MVNLEYIEAILNKYGKILSAKEKEELLTKFRNSDNHDLLDIAKLTALLMGTNGKSFAKGGIISKQSSAKQSKIVNYFSKIIETPLFLKFLTRINNIKHGLEKIKDTDSDVKVWELIFLLSLCVTFRIGIVVSDSLAPLVPTGAITLCVQAWIFKNFDWFYYKIYGSSWFLHFLVKNNCIVNHAHFETRLPPLIYHQVIDYGPNNTLLIMGLNRAKSYINSLKSSFSTFKIAPKHQIIPLDKIVGVHIFTIGKMNAFIFPIYKLITTYGLWIKFYIFISIMVYCFRQYLGLIYKELFNVNQYIVEKITTNQSNSVRQLHNLILLVLFFITMVINNIIYYKQVSGILTYTLIYCYPWYSL